MTAKLHAFVLVLLVSVSLSPAATATEAIEEAWYLMRSRANMKIGNYVAAIEAYEKYLELKPGDREALKRIAVAYEKQGQTDKAIARYDKYLEVFQDDAETAFKQADYLTWSRYAYRKADAVKYLGMGLALKDDAAQRLKYARLLAADRYDLDSAVEQYEILLSKAPQNDVIRTEYRNLLLWDERFLSKAILQYEYLVARNPDDFASHRKLAELLTKSRKRRPEAAQIYAQLVHERPDDLKLRHDYAKLLAADRYDLDSAVEQYEILLSKAPQNDVIRTEYRKLLLWDERFLSKAILQYEYLVARNPDDFARRRKLAELLTKSRKRRPEAAQIYAQLVHERPGDLKLRHDYAKLLAADRYDLDSAVEQYEILLSKAPQNDVIRTEYRNLLLWDERFLSKAILQYEYLVARNPDDFARRRKLAELLTKSRKRRPEAAQIYAQLVHERPGDRKLRHDYAKLLARIDDRLEDARRQYRLLLVEGSDYEIATEAAALLSRTADTHPEAIKIYTTLLQQRPGDTGVRMKRAALYMNRKSDAALALEDYRYVISSQPKHVGAHRGAAEALAWLDEADQALYHANLAAKYAREDGEARILRDQLARGREPRVLAFIEIPHQSGSDFELTGTRLGVHASFDPSPFVSLHANVGSERYDSDSDYASGSWWLLGGQYRLDSKRRVDVEIGDRSIRKTGDSQILDFAYTDDIKYAPWIFSAGFKLAPVEESFLSLVGDPDADIGGASRNEIFVEYIREDESRRLSLRPSLGWVDSESESANEFLALAGSVEYPMDWLKETDTRLGIDVKFLSYSNDHSGFEASQSEPLSGGYFSPQSFLELYLYTDFVKPVGYASELNVRIGPKIQYVEDAEVEGEVGGGLSGFVSYTQKRSNSSYLILKAEHDLIDDRYRRTVLGGQLVFIF